MLIYQQLIRAFFKCSNLDTTKHVTILRAMHLAGECKLIALKQILNHARDKSAISPSVSALGTVKSSSLATCLCPNDPARGNDEGVKADECGAEFVADNEGGKSAGLHGECELAEVLVDAASGTPAVEGYKS